MALLELDLAGRLDRHAGGKVSLRRRLTRRILRPHLTRMREGNILKLVVVESPAKAKTIEKYLGSGHRVLASFGHVRDLPPKDGSVDPEQGFDMLWQVSPDRSKQLKAITDEAKKADTLILATDPDREGEAISWHVQEVLRQKKALPEERPAGHLQRHHQLRGDRGDEEAARAR